MPTILSTPIFFSKRIIVVPLSTAAHGNVHSTLMPAKEIRQCLEATISRSNDISPVASNPEKSKENSVSFSIKALYLAQFS